MIPGSFEYHRPRTLDEAIGLLADHGDGANIVAGGHSLIPMMKLRLAAPVHLIDLQDIDALKGISESGNNIEIGAMTTQAELIESDLLAAKCPIIRETSMQIADPQVRNCGTLGGNVANGDPGNDMPALMQALNASYLVQGPEGKREIAAREFYEDIFLTTLQEGEILKTIRIPTPAPGHGYAYEKQKRKIGDYATAAAAVLMTMTGGKCASGAIALTNVASTPLYAADASDALIGTNVDKAIVDNVVSLAKAITNPSDDTRGPAEFRTSVAGVVVRRAISRALERTS